MRLATNVSRETIGVPPRPPHNPVRPDINAYPLFHVEQFRSDFDHRRQGQPSEQRPLRRNTDPPGISFRSRLVLDQDLIAEAVVHPNSGNSFQSEKVETVGWPTGATGGLGRLRDDQQASQGQGWSAALCRDGRWAKGPGGDQVELPAHLVQPPKLLCPASDDLDRSKPHSGDAATIPGCRLAEEKLRAPLTRVQ
jgi:hypothetical protein